MDLEDLLAPVAGLFNVEDALAEWRWLVPQPLRPLVVTAMGDLFLIDEDGAVLLLDTIEGTCERVASSVDEWKSMLADPEITDQWFLTGLVLELREMQPLQQGECYDPIHAPILGGTFDVENWQRLSWRVHFSHSGRMHEAIKDLPEGTKISGWNFTVLPSK